MLVLGDARWPMCADHAADLLGVGPGSAHALLRLAHLGLAATISIALVILLRVLDARDLAADLF
jgi:hypothetical protein